MDREVALVTGIAGGLARRVAHALHDRGYHVVGVDYRSLPSASVLPEGTTLVRAHYNKTGIEDVFRRHRPSLALHLGRVGNLKEQLEKRFELNVIGGQKIAALCLKYGVRRLVVLSTFHIYGADPMNHTPISEDDPLRAGTEFPEIADAIQLDNHAWMTMYRYPQMQTVVLRPCNVVGPGIQNAMSRFLRQPRVPVMMGFDPMVQFVHERDLTSAILAVAGGTAIGVFNVAGKSALPWSAVVDLAGASRVPVPSSLAFAYLRVASLFTSTLPPYLVNFIKHPCVISDEAIRRTFGWAPQVDEAETIRSTVGRSCATLCHDPPQGVGSAGPTREE
jgi:UDP-glucose 4-epimerase